MKITQNLDGITIKSRQGLRPILAFHYSGKADREELAGSLRFLGVSVNAVYPSRDGSSVVNVAVKNGADIDTVIASLNVPYREQYRRRY